MAADYAFGSNPPYGWSRALACVSMARRMPIEA
jgi:hypothetical protein